jgi:hypothetical protein
MYVCMYVCICIYMYIHIYIYICIDMRIRNTDSEMDLEVPGLRGAGLSRGDVSTPYNVSLSASGTYNGQ